MGAIKECDVTNCTKKATWWTVYFTREYGYCDYHQRNIRWPPPKKYWKKK